MVPVSMVMICRDNHGTIGDVLQDALDAGCAELCCVDTGSLDDTIEIAKSKGAKVIERKWIDDFAHSKNQALAMADNDWCLVLDSDDRIADPAAMRKFFENDLERLPKTVDAMIVEVHVGVGPQAWMVTQVRFIKKSSGLKFRYPIHETVICDGHDVIPFTATKITHHHALQRGHSERNMRILRNQRESAGFNDKPQDEQQHIRMNLGREYLGLGDKAGAEKIYEEYFRETSPGADLYWAWFYYAMSTDDFNKKMSRLRYASRANPSRAEPYVEMGRLLLERKKWKQALLELERARHATYPLDGTAYPPDYTWRPALFIAVCLDGMKMHDLAWKFAREAQARGCPPELIKAQA